MNVAGEIQVVDLRPLKNSRLLCANVRRKEEQAVLSVFGRQVRSTSIQLVDDDGNVLVLEVSFFFYQVSNGPAGCPPGDNAIETGQGPGGQADVGLRHPLLESLLVCVQISRRCPPRHVRYDSMFINNELHIYMNATQRLPVGAALPPRSRYLPLLNRRSGSSKSRTGPRQARGSVHNFGDIWRQADELMLSSMNRTT